MFINKDEFERRKSEDNNLAVRLKVPPTEPIDLPELDTTRFKHDGTQREVPLFPMGMRALIAATAIMTTAKEAAEVFDVSPSLAQALKSGDYSQATDPEEREAKNQQLKEAIFEELGSIRDKARTKLLKVLDLIDDTNLQAIPDKDKARLAAQMANQLSGVIDKTIQKSEKFTDQRQAHLHLYSPEQRKLEAFEIKRINPAPHPEDDASAG